LKCTFLKPIIDLLHLHLMKKLFVFCIAGLFIVSCKKNDNKKEQPTPEPPKTGTINFTVLAYDSLGQAEVGANGVNISIYQTGLSAVTNSAGLASVSSVSYGLAVPVLSKIGYDAPPFSVNVNAPSVAVNIPVARVSPYKITTLNSQFINKDSMTLSFNLSQIIPAGKQVKMAVLFSDVSTFNVNNFKSVDFVNVSTQNISNLNFAKLSNFKAGVSPLPMGTPFYINIVAISYGIYNSNLSATPVLLGENLYYQNNLSFLKNWN
jgi:hypothetical protein